ncbi:MAG: hypothetical protein ACRD4H_04510 [Candidatus Acidiferrales bacterium]
MHFANETHYRSRFCKSLFLNHLTFCDCAFHYRSGSVFAPAPFRFPRPKLFMAFRNSKAAKSGGSLSAGDAPAGIKLDTHFKTILLSAKPQTLKKRGPALPKAKPAAKALTAGTRIPFGAESCMPEGSR